MSCISEASQVETHSRLPVLVEENFIGLAEQISTQLLVALSAK